MTRFFVSVSCENTVRIIIETLQQNNYNFRVNNFGTVSQIFPFLIPIT